MIFWVHLSFFHLSFVILWLTSGEEIILAAHPTAILMKLDRNSAKDSSSSDFVVNLTAAKLYTNKRKRR